MLTVAAATAAGCGVGPEPSPKIAADDGVPFELLTPNAPTVIPPATAKETQDVTLCFIEGEKVAMVQRTIDAPASFGDVVEAMAEPPPDTTSLRTALGPPSLVDTVGLNVGVVRVNLTTAVSSLGGNNQLLAIAQLVCALTARPGVGQVAFSLAGSPVDVPRGDGSLTSAPVSRDDYAGIIK